MKPWIPDLKQRLDPRHWRGFLLASVSGTALALLFPEVGWWPLAFVALVPLMMAVEGQPPPRAFRFGFWSGFLYFAGSLSWLEYTLEHFGHLPEPVAWSLICLLAFYLALYPALCCFLMAKSRLSSWPYELKFAVFWVAMEGIRGTALTGFPWNLLGYGVGDSLLLVQLADIGGVYGLSFYLVIVNGLLFKVFFSGKRDFFRHRALLALLLLAAGFGYGVMRLSETPPTRSFRLALVQHNPLQEEKWNPRYRDTLMESLYGLSRRAAEKEPDLLVWPEAATPFWFRHYRSYRSRVAELVHELGIPLLLGSPDKDRPTARRTNSAFLLDRSGEIVGRYDKMKLVPFGEYVPLRRLLFFVQKMVELGGSFSAGDTPTVFRTEKARFSVAICFESLFGELIADFVDRGAEFLVVLTNDSWFGETAGAAQHLSFVRFRAVETRRPIAQAAQSGYSAVFDGRGRLLRKTDLGEAAVIVQELHLSLEQRKTWYVEFGDWVVYLAWLSALVLAVVSRLGAGTGESGKNRRGAAAGWTPT